MKFLHILFLFLLTTYIHTFEHSASEEWNDKLENALDRLLNLVGTVEQMVDLLNEIDFVLKNMAELDILVVRKVQDKLDFVPHDDIKVSPIPICPRE
ncbi:uncharacterized protein CELE_F36D1.23 [Caenorhabditis elegans]|uniref:Secreted protein n=1 Tax=Caenorhabditis elegans TaxID=6239 RepID=H2L2I1_CAEEL|nr:Secreted protein [Caenorhabditis elegans]CCE71614.1 Secreted protein [Caenorhabditis elegans]|eukprot:NP_001251608.1 Uncharacterized protein CELE_F36D1.23 [Caenorhabditis elegans]